MKTFSTVLLLVLASTFLVACIGDKKPASEVVPAMEDKSAVEPVVDGMEPTEGEESAVGTSVMAVSGKVAVSAKNFSYDVAEIKAKVGEPLTISVTNAEGFHDFMIDELEVNSEMIPAGETVDLVIPTDKPGTYEYYCSVGEHRQMGMKGMLIIE